MESITKSMKLIMIYEVEYDFRSKYLMLSYFEKLLLMHNCDTVEAHLQFWTED